MDVTRERRTSGGNRVAWGPACAWWCSGESGESSGKKGKRTSSRIELCSGVAGGVRGGVALPLPVAAFSRPPSMPAGSSFVGVGGGVASASCRLAAASLAPIDSV